MCLIPMSATNMQLCGFLLLVASLASCSEIDMLKDYLVFKKDYSIANGYFCKISGLRKLTKTLHEQNVRTRFFVMNKNVSLEQQTVYANKAINILDTTCEHFTKVLQQAASLLMFASPFKWLLVTTREEFSKMLTIMSNLNIQVDSSVSMAIKETDSSYEIRKIYKLKPGLHFVLESEGGWTETVGYVNYETLPILAVRRKNLNGITINTCLVITHNNSLMHLMDKREKHIDTIAKVNYVFMLHLMDILNISMNFSVANTWGYKNNQSEWSGMIGELSRKHAEIGGTPLFITSDRVAIIDYISMTTPTRSKFVFRQPKLSYITNVFTLPFHDDVWAATICLGGILAITLYLVTKWEWRKKKFTQLSNESNVQEMGNSFSDAAMLIFGAVCQQGAYVIPYTISGRIIIIFSFVSLMFLYTSYSANIVALLQSSSTSIQTLDDLLNSRLRVGVDDTVFNRFYFPNASEPVRKALYEKKVAPPSQEAHFLEINEGISRMRQGLFAFHMETGAGYKIVGETFMEDEKCDLQEIQFLQVPDPWLAIQKNSSFKEMIKIGLFTIHECGIQSREVSLLYTKKPVCTTRGTAFIGVGIVDCYPATVVLAGGIIMSVIILMLEHLVHTLFRYKDFFKFFRRAPPAA